MTDSLAYGLTLVLGAGACQGSFMLPTKWINGWAWENYWLIFSSTAYRLGMREHVLTLKSPERRELKKRLRSRTLPAEDVRRAR